MTLMNRMKNIAILLLLLVHGGLRAEPTEESFKRISTADGLSSAVVTDIIQDSRGFMWFGTQDGLNRYDGYTFKIYRHSDTVAGSIGGNYILALYNDPWGGISAGTEGNGLSFYDRSKDRFTVYRHNPDDPRSIPGNTVRAITQAAEHVLYVGTDRGTCLFRPDEGTFEPLPVRVEDSLAAKLPVYVLYFDARDRTLWIGTSSGLFHYLPDERRAEAYLHDPSDAATISNNFINCIIRSKEGQLLVGTNQGVDQFDPVTGTFARYHHMRENPRSEVQAMKWDDRGNMWLGLFGSGLEKIEPATGRTTLHVHEIDRYNSLSSDYITSLYPDRAGILWIGTYGGGVNMLDLTRVRFEHLQAGEEGRSLPSNEVYGILPSRDEVWFGTEQGVSIWTRSTDRFTDPGIPGKAGAAGNAVYSLAEDEAGNIWIGSAADGLYLLAEKNRRSARFEFIAYAQDAPPDRQLVHDAVLCLHPAPDSSLWVGTSGGISVIREGRVTANFTSDPSDTTSLADNEVYCIHTDRAGRIWIGTFLGLNRFNPYDSTFIFYDRLLGDEPVNSIYSIHEDGNGNLWFGTDNSGLIKFDPAKGNTISHYDRSGQLPDNVIYGILEDKEGNLWLSTNSGLVKAIPRSGSDDLTFIQYSTANWLSTDSYNIGAYAQGPEGTLYFGSFEGVTYFHPDDVKGNTAAPPVYITGLEIFFRKVAVSDDGSTPLSEDVIETEEIRLRHDQNVLKLEFAALNYLDPEENLYAFKMENLDNDWNFAGNQREAQYMYIPPGEYVFRVRAANNDGVWNDEGRALRITIVPPFTRTAWFYLILVAGFTALILWIMNFRTRQLKAARNRLEKQVQKRTGELRETNTSLNRALEDLRRTQAQLIDSEKMASLGQLTAGVAHEINNPINFVSGNVQPLRRDIQDILSILRQYDEIVRQHHLEGAFKSIEAFKEDLDFDLVLSEIDKLLDGIGEGAARTAEIVKGLRNFSRMDEHELKPASINQGIDSTLLILHNKIKDRIEVIRDYGEFPDIMCHPGQLNQVFMNILNNAQEAIEGKGTITIRTRKAGDSVRISIRDSGKGIPEEARKKIFDPFFTTKEVGKGTGLGLSISYGIIEKHNGTIEVKSEPGKGSEFIITLPAKPNDNNE